MLFLEAFRLILHPQASFSQWCVCFGEASQYNYHIICTTDDLLLYFIAAFHMSISLCMFTIHFLNLEKRPVTANSTAQKRC